MFKESKIILDNIKLVNKNIFWSLKYDSLIMMFLFCFHIFFPNIKRIKQLMKHLYIIYKMIKKNKEIKNIHYLYENI